MEFNEARERGRKGEEVSKMTNEELLPSSLLHFYAT
jgi:hypothetical protein